MMLQHQIGSPLPWPDLFNRIKARAAAADRGGVSLALDLRETRQSGLLAAITQAEAVDPVRAAHLLRRLGRVSLPVGRLIEGHVNALKLIGLYGSAAQRMRAAEQAGDGVIFGVWGADGTPKTSFTPVSASCVALNGEKRFCSGLGVLGRAIVTADTPDGTQLLLADVTDPDRADATAWQVSGMRATVSGRYDMNGQQAELVGSPGDYGIEPYSEGGIWRYCALHTGGLEALAEFVRQHIGLQPSPHQFHRIARLAVLAETARLHVDAAAAAVHQAGNAPQIAVARALLAREAVEQACLDGLAIADRALGTTAFRHGSAVDMCRRDLAFFLRQANLDGKLTAAATAVIALQGEVGDQW